MSQILEAIEHGLASAAGVVWGFPKAMPAMVVALIGTGLILTIRLKLINVRGFWHAIRVVKGDYDDPSDPGDISHFQALTTALSATVGVGNIAGVATAIHYGGPGALFWMWVTALIGMTTKYTECSLATRYRKDNADGTVSGGPMYYIEQGLGSKWKPLALFFAGCAVISSFASGNGVQANSMAQTMSSEFGLPTFATGIFSAIMVGLVILGGIQRIGNFTSKIIPLMALLYFVGASTILVLNAGAIPAALQTIFVQAFTPTAAIGGFAGSTLLFTLVWGVKRGLFSNEAGQGSAPIAHAAAKTDEPIREGVVALLEPFIDTLTICTLTGLVILTTGVWNDKRMSEVPFNAQSSIKVVHAKCTVGKNAELADVCKLPPESNFTIRDGKSDAIRFIRNHALVEDAGLYRKEKDVTESTPFAGTLHIDKKGAVSFTLPNSTEKITDVILRGKQLQNGAALTAWAFARGLEPIMPYGAQLVTICVFLFALSTAIGWSYYGERSVQYLVGDRAIVPYRMAYIAMHFGGAVLSLEAVWSFGDIALGLMALPNLLAILLLSKRVVEMTNDYFSREHKVYK